MVSKDFNGDQWEKCLENVPRLLEATKGWTVWDLEEPCPRRWYEPVCPKMCGQCIGRMLSEHEETCPHDIDDCEYCYTCIKLRSKSTGACYLNPLHMLLLNHSTVPELFRKLARRSLLGGLLKRIEMTDENHLLAKLIRTDCF